MTLGRLLFIGLVLTSGTSACTSTSTTVTPIGSPGAAAVSLDGRKVAVLPFSGPSGPAARQIATRVLVQQHHASLVPPSKVDTYTHDRGFTPTEYDVEALRQAANELGADVLVWGDINQFTGYSFDRFAPATPPYVDMTIHKFGAGGSTVGSVNAHKQGGLPATIWSRQPTFDDVAEPALADALNSP